jgi:peptide deformylase
MKLQNLLLLGDHRLYEPSAPVERDELELMRPVVGDMHDILMEFRAKYQAGRAIAAPQIGVMKRLIYMHIDRPLVFINPVITEESPEMMELWDDCMCFPNLLVRVKRHYRCRITFRDLQWQEQSMILENELSELLQHEYDHLNGTLAIQRAIEPTAFKWRP